MRKYKSIIFDLDGTLLDTLNDIGNAANRVLSRHNFPVHTMDAYRYFVGDGIRMLVARALPADKQNESMIRTCTEEFNREYAHNWNNETTLYPGIEEMLDTVRSRGYKLAILSNKPHEFTRDCVEAFLSKWEFDVVLGNQASVPHKPDPSGALSIARRMGVSPASFIYLGDTGTDMRTATSAGMYPVGALWGFRSLDELMENGAKAVVHQPSELEGLCG